MTTGQTGVQAGPLQGRVAVITGAAGGIGGAIAAVLAARGATLALIDRVDSALLGANDRSFRCDLSDAAAIESLGAEIGRTMGRVDILVNNAGIGLLGAAEALSAADWDATMAVNLRAPWLLSKACFPWLSAAGTARVVTISSQAALIGLPDHVAYAASKAGLLGMTKTMAVEWARHGITVNCISPTVVETPLALVGWAGEKGDRARAEIPTGRFARPEEIAAAVAFLCSDDAGMITGENLVIDGGNTIR